MILLIQSVTALAQALVLPLAPALDPSEDRIAEDRIAEDRIAEDPSRLVLSDSVVKRISDVSRISDSLDLDDIDSRMVIAVHTRNAQGTSRMKVPMMAHS